MVSKESPKLLVGCLSRSEVLPPGDSEQKRPVVYQDPFRMSVLDFQHRAMERLAEILKSFLLVYIKDMKAKKANSEGSESRRSRGHAGTA